MTKRGPYREAAEHRADAADPVAPEAEPDPDWEPTPLVSPVSNGRDELTLAQGAAVQIAMGIAVGAVIVGLAALHRG